MERLRSEVLNGVLQENCEPIDKSKVESLMEAYKNLNRNEQIYFLLNVGGCNKPSGLDLLRTTAWLRANFTEDVQVAIPKEDVYLLYSSQAMNAGVKPVSTADFGKIVRQVFPEVKARRLGQRGSSKYCYANIRRKQIPDEPTLPEIPPCGGASGGLDGDKSSEEKILTWGSRVFGVPLQSLEEFTQVMAINGGGGGGAGAGGGVAGCSRIQPQPSSIIKRENSTDDDPELVNLQMPHLRSLLQPHSFIPLKRRHVSAYPSSDVLQPPPPPPLPIRSASVPVGDNYNSASSQGDSNSAFGGSEGSTPRNPMLSSTADIFQPEEEMDLFGELFGF